MDDAAKSQISRRLFTTVKTIFAVFGLIVMFFAAIFYLGSKEHWDYAVANTFWTFFSARLCFVFVAGFPFFLLCLGINLGFRKKIPEAKSRILPEFAWLIAVSLIMTSILFLL